MSDWTRKLNWNHRMWLNVIALALVSAAVSAGVASAKPPEIGAQFKLNTSGTDPYQQDWRQVQSEQQAMARKTEIGARFKLNTSETDPYQQDWRQVLSEQSSVAHQTSPSAEPSPGGVTPTNLVRAYVPRNEGVAAPVGGRSFELGDAALGFGLGLLLATGCTVAIVLSRRGMRMAHS